jgi:DNA-3-methyladenine glycosylase II
MKERMSSISNISFSIKPLAPFRLDLTVWVLRRRSDNSTDRWDGSTYRRVLVLQGKPVEVAVNQTDTAGNPRLQVTVNGEQTGRDTRAIVTSALERLLGIQIDLAAFYRFAASDPKLGKLAEKFVGMKPPRFPDLFESLVNAISGQQVTLTLAIRLLNKLAENYGRVFHAQELPAHAFPAPKDLAMADHEELRAMGFSRQKARALIELACALAEERLDLGQVATMDDEAAVASLCGLHGVGRWTAEYVLLRGMGRLHIFPGDDVGARKNLERWLGMDAALDYEGVHRSIAPWKSYGGLIYFHLLLDSLQEAGHL